MQPQDCSSTGVRTDLTRSHQRPTSPQRDSSLHLLFLPLGIKASTICPLQFIPSICHRPEVPRTFLLLLYRNPLWRGGTAKPAKKHRHHVYSSTELTRTAPPSTASPNLDKEQGRHHTWERLYRCCRGSGSD